MILLIWTSERAADCARAIEQAFQQPVDIVPNARKGCESLKAAEYSAVLLDQGVIETELAETEELFQGLGSAVPVIVNFAISGIGRVLREVRAALNRYAGEARLARQRARNILRDELKDDVTALLLSCGIALQEQTLTEPLAQRIRTIEAIAGQLRSKLTDGERPTATLAIAKT